MKNTRKKGTIIGATVLAAVPYQCCPLCNGAGTTVADGFTSSVYKICRVCNGAGIIPMHIVDWKVPTGPTTEY